MIYSVKTYRAAFLPTSSIRTVLRRIENNQLPTHHVAIKCERDWIIHTREISETASLYVEAAMEFQACKKGRDLIGLCAELSVKFNIGITKLTKMLGV